jgi:hypothetical protein
LEQKVEFWDVGNQHVARVFWIDGNVVASVANVPDGGVGSILTLKVASASSRINVYNLTLEVSVDRVFKTFGNIVKQCCAIQVGIDVFHWLL